MVTLRNGDSELLFCPFAFIPRQLRLCGLSPIQWTIPGIFGAVFYFHAFESGFWIVGLYAGTALVVAILLLTERKTDIRQTLRSLPVRIAAILLPVIFIAFASCIIRHINYDRYGVNAVSIFTGTNFPRFIKALYSVKPNNNDYNLPVAVPTETIRRICKVSPTLAPYETSLIAAILTWGRGGRFPDDNEIESGWFYWCILQLFEKKSFEEQQHIFEHKVTSPLPGSIIKVMVSEGQDVKKGDTLLTLESMKMENAVMADRDGKVAKIAVTAGQTVMQDDLLVVLG